MSWRDRRFPGASCWPSPSVLGVVLAPRCDFDLRVEPDVAANATEYLRITSACSVAILFSYLCGAVLRGAGDSRTPLKAAVLANAVNVVVAYVLIFGHFGFPELGVGGSAWGAAPAGQREPPSCW